MSLSTVALVAAMFVAQDTAPVERTNLAAALDAARWIQNSGRDTEHGRVWPSVPAEPDSVSLHLYSGTPGVVLFFGALHEATGEPEWRAEAIAGADHLLATIPQEADPRQAGFYTGLSGRAFVLAETARTCGEPRFREGAKRLTRAIAASAREVGEGLEWNGVTDIIAGTAGIGLSLLWAAEHLDMPDMVEVAAKAGRHLIERGRPAEDGLKWSMSANYARLMPNFSHGTAGIAYFLLELHRVTEDEGFLKAANGASTYLQAIANRDREAFRVFHHEPEGEDLYYLGFCHGPVGTSRFFWHLWKTTGDESAREAVLGGARALQTSGLPEKQTPGYWNNVSVCCGSAGVARFFLDLHAALGDEDSLPFAERVNRDLLARGTRDEQGLRWTQAEHRVRPDFLQAQTGYMQGASGIGLWLLRMDAFEQGRPWKLRFPDTPF